MINLYQQQPEILQQTPRSIVLPERANIHSVKKFHPFYGTRMFITVFTTALEVSQL
jgi:hypothetical protein